MKTVDELMALADTLAEKASAYMAWQTGSTGMNEARAALLSALQEVVQPVAQPLSDEQINKMWDELKRPLGTGWLPIEGFARAVELAHGIGGKE